MSRLSARVCLRAAWRRLPPRRFGAARFGAAAPDFAAVPKAGDAAVALATSFETAVGAAPADAAAAAATAVPTDGAAPPEEPEEVKPKLVAVAEEMDLDIVYEDADLVVVNKAVGMVMHPSPGWHSGTIVNGLLYRYRDDALADTWTEGQATIRPGIVQRLDRGTSGCVVLSKTKKGHRALCIMFEHEPALKVYLAVTTGAPAEALLRVDAPLLRDHDLKRTVVSEEGKRAVSHFRTVATNGSSSVVECRLETGRTHQLRAHLGHVGAPILDDPVYGDGAPDALPILHAQILGFRHPITGDDVRFEVAPPQAFLDLMRQVEPGLYSDPVVRVTITPKPPPPEVAPDEADASVKAPAV
ncbi:pseudouridine synthase [Pelagophyceae sp. CCMP2097]|nr:pseudouridine synthase [Pelagophyceae sp. CCMP2097]